MEKFTRLFIVLLGACGLVLAQADSQKTQPDTQKTQPDTQKMQTDTQKMQADTQKTATAGSPSPAGAVIQQWRGTLVDASCTSGPKATEQNSGVDSGRPQKSRWHRGSKDAPPPCAATKSTNVFAVQTDTGDVKRFDAVGNSRAAEALKSKEKWTKELAANKPIRAKISGLLSGDTITVTAID